MSAYEPTAVDMYLVLVEAEARRWARVNPSNCNRTGFPWIQPKIFHESARALGFVDDAGEITDRGLVLLAWNREVHA